MCQLEKSIDNFKQEKYQLLQDQVSTDLSGEQLSLIRHLTDEKVFFYSSPSHLNTLSFVKDQFEQDNKELRLQIKQSKNDQQQLRDHLDQLFKQVTQFHQEKVRSPRLHRSVDRFLCGRINWKMIRHNLIRKWIYWNNNWTRAIETKSAVTLFTGFSSESLGAAIEEVPRRSIEHTWTILEDEYQIREWSSTSQWWARSSSELTDRWFHRLRSRL